MKTIRDLYEEKQDNEFQQQLDEGFATVAATAANVLGYTALSGFAAFGGAMLVAAGVRGKVGSKIKNFFRRIAGKPINMKKGAEKLRDKSAVKSTYDAYKNSDTAKRLDVVLDAIRRKDYEEALNGYRATGLVGDPEAIRVISLAVTEAFNEPPLYYISPGNTSYQFLKRIVGPGVAKSVSDSVIFALNKNKDYFMDVDVSKPAGDSE